MKPTFGRDFYRSKLLGLEAIWNLAVGCGTGCVLDPDFVVPLCPWKS